MGQVASLNVSLFDTGGNTFDPISRGWVLVCWTGITHESLKFEHAVEGSKDFALGIGRSQPRDNFACN